MLLPSLKLLQQLMLLPSLKLLQKLMFLPKKKLLCKLLVIFQQILVAQIPMLMKRVNQHHKKLVQFKLPNLGIFPLLQMVNLLTLMVTNLTTIRVSFKEKILFMKEMEMKTKNHQTQVLVLINEIENYAEFII